MLNINTVKLNTKCYAKYANFNPNIKHEQNKPTKTRITCHSKTTYEPDKSNSK